ncbi:MAG: hypothetical protein ACI4A7_01905 [Prevotella sp.]
MKRMTYIKPYVKISVTEQESPLCSSGTTPVIPTNKLNGIQGEAVMSTDNTQRIWLGSQDILLNSPVINDSKGDNLWSEWEE